jgi:hypothetical protein
VSAPASSHDVYRRECWRRLWILLLSDAPSCAQTSADSPSEPTPADRVDRPVMAAHWADVRPLNGDTSAAPEALTSDHEEVAIGRERQEEAPAPTGAGEILPELDTRKDVTS